MANMAHIVRGELQWVFITLLYLSFETYTQDTWRFYYINNNKSYSSNSNNNKPELQKHTDQ